MTDEPRIPLWAWQSLTDLATWFQLDGCDDWNQALRTAAMLWGLNNLYDRGIIDVPIPVAIQEADRVLIENGYSDLVE